MKKTVFTFVLCLLIIFITACGNTNRSDAAFGNTMEFSSSEEMLKYLEGMWLVGDNINEKSYYIFRDGQIYFTTDTMYSAQVKNILNSTLQNGGLERLYILNFGSISNRIFLSNVSIAPGNVSIAPGPISLCPQNGEIKLYEGSYDEKSIIITEESVMLVTGDTKSGTVMTKLSDTADFSTDYFESLFNQVLDSYEIPSKHFLIDTIEYGEKVKTIIPQFDWWSLTWSDDDLKIYTPDETFSSLDGSCLAISKQTLTFAYKLSVSTGFVGKDHKESLVITYCPEEGSFQVIETNNPSMNLYSLIEYGIYAVQNVPKAYTDPVELFNDMVTYGQRDSSDMSERISMTANGITYELYEFLSTTGGTTLGQFTIKVDETISLNTILEGTTENTEQETVPSQSDSTSNGGNTSQQPTSCSHNYANATCTTPKTCTLCGKTSGSALGHAYSAATCTAPQTCNSCGATTGSAAGHKWKSATCTEPERCTVCEETGAEAYGHSMVFTKCRHSSCDYVDFSCIAGTYTNIGGYGVPVGTTTMVDVDITNVSISNTGELSFTYNEKNYTLTLKQNNQGDRYMAYFDCYLNGVLVENVDFRAGNEMYNNRIYLDAFIIDGCIIYLYATR